MRCTGFHTASWGLSQLQVTKYGVEGMLCTPPVYLVFKAGFSEGSQRASSYSHCVVAIGTQKSACVLLFLGGYVALSSCRYLGELDPIPGIILQL